MTQALSEAFVKNYDPTKTTGLRKAFSISMKKKFNELARVVKKSIVDNDCFGLTNHRIITQQMTPANWQQFNNLRSAEKLEAFLKWLQDQIDRGILNVRTFQQMGTAIESQWMNLYLFDAYKRGVIRARYEMIKAGIAVPTIEESGGIDIIMGLPMHIDRLGLIFSKAYTDLKGITEVMDSIISRILAQGLANGDSPSLLARKIVEAINSSGEPSIALKDALGRNISAIQRATILARTEVIRAHHLATIQEYRNWGVEGIKVQGEWKTAGDDRVCEKCASLEGQIFSLDQIEYMIPLHPQCRCIALPYIQELEDILKQK